MPERVISVSDRYLHHRLPFISEKKKLDLISFRGILTGLNGIKLLIESRSLFYDAHLYDLLVLVAIVMRFCTGFNGIKLLIVSRSLFFDAHLYDDFFVSNTG